MNEPENRKALINQMQFLGQMASTETALFHQAAAAKLGLGITDMKTVSTLQQEGPMTAGQLAQRLNLTTGAVSNVIDRLEQRKFVKREPDAKDRRKVIVTVNQKNLAPSDNIYRSMGEAFERLLETYSTQELEFLVKYNQATIELTMLESAKLTKGYNTTGHG
ncbi:MarR family winged helix-turn-helix transcriptional regulator [Cohnella silvisoli]|uniref:MarR family transcriptional regulator n=1 Tax=Cohnella silvisoli TaxID=2873699 RepID=A0ABV1L0Q1_9BACL|nr:MarR family transcriptional regulator [Cohnella silvisoli]MCD9025097.1 MarR family transcriptional regulator [Cohnella silvisoli]